MKRVMIIGGPGSGKSTLGGLLADKTGLPLYHMDHIHYRPGWDERTTEEKDVLCHQIHMKDQWIFEGGHSRTLDERIARADTLIWLEMSVWLRLRRCLWRTITNHGKTRPDLHEGCPERFDLDFYRFIWRTRNSSAANIRQKLASSQPHLKIHHFTSLNEVKELLSHLNN
jgi:adenylate kinase family enzyme